MLAWLSQTTVSKTSPDSTEPSSTESPSNLTEPLPATASEKRVREEDSKKGSKAPNKRTKKESTVTAAVIEETEAGKNASPQPSEEVNIPLTGQSRRIGASLPTESLVESDIDLCKKEPVEMGIDEAGRGPVLGPMVYATAFWPIKKRAEFSKLGFADSKTLNEEQRDALFDQILDNNIGFICDVISPEELSEKMLLLDRSNLNTISKDSAANLIRRVKQRGVNLTHVYVDTVGIADKYEAWLKSLFPGLEVTVSTKADSKFPVVSAASICAKVLRDERVKNWKFGEQIAPNKEFGSGYPGDPVTKAWLRSGSNFVFGFPTFVRFGWKTCVDLVKLKCVAVDWGEKEDEDEDQVMCLSRPNKRAELSGVSSRFRYFADRKMELITDFK